MNHRMCTWIAIYLCEKYLQALVFWSFPFNIVHIDVCVLAEAVDRWRTEKLEAVRKMNSANPTINTSTTVREASRHIKYDFISNFILLNLLSSLS